MKYYVKVTKQVAETVIRSGVPLTMTSDGNCLLYQSELNDVPGVNLSARAAYAGGALIEEHTALSEIDGSVVTPAYCYTPVEYGGDGDTRNKDEFGADMPDASASENSGSTDETPSAIEESPSTENTENKKESEVTNE